MRRRAHRVALLALALVVLAGLDAGSLAEAGGRAERRHYVGRFDDQPGASITLDVRPGGRHVVIGTHGVMLTCEDGSRLRYRDPRAEYRLIERRRVRRVVSGAQLDGSVQLRSFHAWLRPRRATGSLFLFFHFAHPPDMAPPVDCSTRGLLRWSARRLSLSPR